jgi:hypothetical protein
MRYYAASPMRDGYPMPTVLRTRPAPSRTRRRCITTVAQSSVLWAEPPASYRVRNVLELAIRCRRPNIARPTSFTEPPIMMASEPIFGSEDGSGFASAGNSNLPLSITHERDTIEFDGQVEQDYRFLVYRFASTAGDIVARAYFDDPWTVSITQPTDGAPIESEVMEYLQQRFDEIRQLGGPNGYVTLWSDSR